MRLNSIKLAGFKSFVEPANFTLPGQLVGVVGPNGCGKSNIMDAVRWVLGESKASELRGETMQDVIFNGTASRRPASRASVELVFDNADQRAGGQWGRFSEVAVKRVLTRDGTSSYYINNQPVRRRDVQDVFLGTGLGPRTYAIIGQGTIGRIIESRPEELRLFLEEAAGVSKYKERRRETERRLADTRANLTRVEDILREMEGQLERLEQQAEVAARYNALHAELALRQQQQWFLKRAESEAEQSRVAAEAERAQIELEGRIADLRRVEAELETVRQAHYAAGDAVNQAQGLLYEISAEAGRLEAEIRFVAEGRRRIEQRIASLAAQRAQWAVRRDAAQRELDDSTASAQQAAQQAALLAVEVERHANELPAAQQALQAARSDADAQRAQLGELLQQQRVLAAEQRHGDEQLQQLEQRRGRLAAERSALEAPDEARLAASGSRLAEFQQRAAQAEARLHESQQQAPRLDDERRALQQSANAEDGRHAALAARLEALEALQERVATSDRLEPWLARHGFGALSALWSRLQVEPGWENALEAALRERLGALEVAQLEALGAFAADDAPPVKLTFFRAPEPHGAPSAPSAPPRCRPLAQLLRLGDAGLQALLDDWLHGCHAAANLDDALAARGRLQPGETIYLASGHAIAAHSMSFHAQDSAQAGLLARAREIENLQRQTRAQGLIAEQARAALARAEAACAQASQQLVAARREAAEAQGRAHETQVETLRLSQRAEQTRARGERLDADLAEIDAQAEELRRRREAAAALVEELNAQLDAARQRHALLDEAAAGAERALADCRELQRKLEREAQEAGFTQRSLAARCAELRREADTAAQQMQSLEDEEAEARRELDRLSDTAAQAALQVALASKLDREAVLAARRSAYDDLSARLRSSDERRLSLERELAPLRERIIELQLAQQAARLGVEQYAQLLADAAADLAALAASIGAGKVRPSGMQTEIERLQREIGVLGAVNLASLDELASARLRREFLQSQSDDLNGAMRTLEAAIAKIDAETRELLAGTFDSVNAHFGRLFPELFGGGRASLVLTGDEILDAGVQVFAQPPGKKNQTIHLLSGGEKALAAIALVFAIFQLNPAPFCLLDEVDAPLDDANTERYAKLVTRMSAQTQFLFISHNKIAMEMAAQLIGVTMQEQGVSRIVAVDLESVAGLSQPA